MRAGEPHPADPRHRPDRPQQLGEERAAAGQVPSVGVDVLAEQRDLGDPSAGQDLDLGHEVVEGAADLGAPHRRHDAERARVVAPRLDGDPGRVGQVAHGRQGCAPVGRVRAGLRPRARRGPRPPVPCVAACRSRARARGPGCGCRRPRRRGGPAGGSRSRSIWARQPPTAICMSGPALAEGLEVAEMSVELVVGVLPDAAGVEHDDVGRLEVGGGHQAVGDQQPGQALGVVLVHLAAEGADVERRAVARLPQGVPQSTSSRAHRPSRIRRPPIPRRRSGPTERSALVEVEDVRSVTAVDDETRACRDGGRAPGPARRLVQGRRRRRLHFVAIGAVGDAEQRGTGARPAHGQGAPGHQRGEQLRRLGKSGLR